MGGGIIGWAIRRPVSVMVGVILVVLFGAISIIGIPIQLTPDITVPTITVETVWPGATPAEVEAEILEEQEESLKSLPGLVRMTSEARQAMGSVTLELEVGASLDEALVRVSNLLAQVPDYPDTARQPVISTASSSGPPVAVIIIQSVPPGREVAEYRTWLEEVIVAQYERIRGVASVRVIGGRELEAHIEFDADALAARGLTISQMVAAIRSELVDISGGDVSMGKRRYVVRTSVAPDDPSGLERTVLATDENGTPITLGQVATVDFGLRKREAIGMFNGAPSMALLFFREAGSNVLEVTEEIHQVTAELQRDYMAANGLELSIVSDQVDYIEGALSLVRNNLIIGGVLAMVVLLLFLRSVGASAVVALSIPISVVGTVLFMALLGRTVNIVSLAGMAFAVGMVVDNSIVVLENIDSWRRREGNVRLAALNGAREVWGAILASTLTTAVVFIPIITWQDEVGELLRDVALAVSTAVFVSLVVSVVVIPSFAARILRSVRPAKSAAQPDENDDDVASERQRWGRIARLVHRMVQSPLRSLLVAGGAAGGALLIAVTLLPPLEYLPTGNRNIVFGGVITPPGYSVDEIEKIGEHIQGRLVPRTGEQGDKLIERSFFVGTPDNVFMGAVAQDVDRIGEVQTAIRSAMAEIPDTFGFASQAALFGRRLGGGRSIEVDIRGSDLGEILGAGQALFGALNQALPGAQIRPIPGLDPGAPELRVEPRRALAASHGLSSADIGLLVDAYVDGAIIGELGRAGEPKRDLVVRARGIDAGSARGLAAAPVATPGGESVSLADVARIDETLGPTVIQRIERRRAITLQVSPSMDIALEDAIAVVSGVVTKLRQDGAIAPGVRIDYSGSAGQLEDAKSRFGFVLLLALIITFLLLAALFEDFIAPLVILVTVPLAAGGGVLGLRLVDATLGAQPLDMMTALGFVILIGVVVNNAILIVDGSLARMRDRGMALSDAVSSAVQWRVRPILMSVTTSLAGLLPLVLFPGDGSELYRGVGAIVLGGLALSTVLSIFVVPALFSLVWRVRRAVVSQVDQSAS